MTLQEELRSLLDRIETEGGGTSEDPKKTTTAPEPVSIKLEDGTVVSGRDYEEIARTLAARRPATESESEPAPSKTPEPPTYSQDEFAAAFVKDGGQGLDYLTERRYGVKFSDALKVLPTLAQTLQTLQQDKAAAEASAFIKETEDFKPSPENYGALQRVAEETGVNLNTRAGLRAAWASAKVFGYVKGEEKRESGPAAPPRAPRGTEENGGSSRQSSLRFEELSDEGLTNLLDSRRNELAAFLRGA